MTVLKEYKGSGDASDPANWETIIVGAPGSPGPASTVPGPAGPPPTTVSLTRAQWLTLSPPDPNTIYIITDEGGVLLSGTTAPGVNTGYNGDFYINSFTWMIYGPKTAGAWGAGTSIKGPTGDPGPPSEDEVTVSTVAPVGAPSRDGLLWVVV